MQDKNQQLLALKKIATFLNSVHAPEIRVSPADSRSNNKYEWTWSVKNRADELVLFASLIMPTPLYANKSYEGYYREPDRHKVEYALRQEFSKRAKDAGFSREIIAMFNSNLRFHDPYPIAEYLIFNKKPYPLADYHYEIHNTAVLNTLNLLADNHEARELSVLEEHPLNVAEEKSSIDFNLNFFKSVNNSKEKIIPVGNEEESQQITRPPGGLSFISI